MPENWPDRITPVLEVRLKHLEAGLALQAWLMRAIAIRSSTTMIGHVGFHTAPDPESLQRFAPEGIELGFTISPLYRRSGYAEEAVSALMR